MHSFYSIVYVPQLSYLFVDIKKRCQEYTEELYKNNLHDPDILELYKNNLHDPDNHDGVITMITPHDGVSHLEPDILEREVKP